MKNIKNRLQNILVELNFIITEIQDYNNDIKNIPDYEAEKNAELLAMSKDLYHVCKTAKNILKTIVQLQKT